MLEPSFALRSVTIAHELGHALGLADLYDTQNADGSSINGYQNDSTKRGGVEGHNQFSIMGVFEKTPYGNLARTFSDDDKRGINAVWNHITTKTPLCSDGYVANGHAYSNTPGYQHCMPVVFEAAIERKVDGKTTYECNNPEMKLNYVSNRCYPKLSTYPFACGSENLIYDDVSGYCCPLGSMWAFGENRCIPFQTTQPGSGTSSGTGTYR